MPDPTGRDSRGTGGSRETARLFFAVMLPAPVIELLGSLIEDLPRGRGVKWQDPAQLHFTIAFLGEVPRSRIPRYQEAGQRAACGQARFSLELKGAGLFPSRRAPRVLWMGSVGGEPLGVLAGALGHELEPLGFVPEGRVYRAHLTLGRVKAPLPPALVDDLMGRIDSHPGSGPIPVTDLCLVESVLSPRGSTYTVIGRFPLEDRAA